MEVSFSDEIRKISSPDLFARDAEGAWNTGVFVGRPYYLDYTRAKVLVADAWKQRAQGIPQGCFLLAYYEQEPEVREAFLLRVLEPAGLPTDSDMVSSVVEYYKDNLETSGEENQLDTYTRYELGFSGLECRILGTYYLDSDDQIEFGADVENFYSAHNYSVVKPDGEILRFIANYREGGEFGKQHDAPIGHVRFSSARRFGEATEKVPVFVTPQDFLGKRTALFGMTRTGKSNTAKKIIQATCRLNDEVGRSLEDAKEDELSAEVVADPFADTGLPRHQVGQIIFDINGEYANPNLQDEGTAISDIFEGRTVRYSTIDKEGFKVLRVNFFNDVEGGFGLIQSALADDGADYVQSFLTADVSQPGDDADHSEQVRAGRRRAAYLCCLHKAGFTAPDGFTVRFQGQKDLNELAGNGGPLDPTGGLSLDQATRWFERIWDEYPEHQYFREYQQRKHKEWADEGLKAILEVLTRKGGRVSGFIKLQPLMKQHTPTAETSYQDDIVRELRAGRIVIVDLSQGRREVQNLHSERICTHVFNDALSRFIGNEANNFVQFYFEEAHNLFPKREDKDLSQIYNRIAKEGAKLNLGLIYITQEVSSISANILKNTQNWFIAHLNNEEETREIRKYYDFEDFADSLVRFSPGGDQGFVRMKTYSNPYVVPVQIDRFGREEG